jgi:signal transduction histidine kinase
MATWVHAHAVASSVYLLSLVIVAGAATQLLLRRRAAHAVLAERRRIARELHDTLAQGLVGVSYQLDILRTTSDCNKGQQLAGRAHDMTRKCLVETRRSLLDLRPEVLERTDLATAVQAMAAEESELSGTAVKASIGGIVRRLDRRVELHVLRVAQEALANSMRHSGATTVAIRLSFGAEMLELSIADDGTGGILHDSGPLRLGILGIEERVNEIGARLSVISRPEGGTELRMLVPLPPCTKRRSLAARLQAWRHR